MQGIIFSRSLVAEKQTLTALVVFVEDIFKSGWHII